jgi:hypothetical protein
MAAAVHCAHHLGDVVKVVGASSAPLTCARPSDRSRHCCGAGPGCSQAPHPPTAPLQGPAALSPAVPEPAAAGQQQEHHHALVGGQLLQTGYSDQKVLHMRWERQWQLQPWTRWWHVCAVAT